MLPPQSGFAARLKRRGTPVLPPGEPQAHPPIHAVEGDVRASLYNAGQWLWSGFDAGPCAPVVAVPSESQGSPAGLRLCHLWILQGLASPGLLVPPWVLCSAGTKPASPGQGWMTP